MFSHYAYISEAGNYQFEGDTASKYFIVTFIVAHQDDYDELKEGIMKWLMLGVEAGNNEEETLKNIAPDLAELPFSIYSFIFNKMRLKEEGSISQKETLFSYANKQIYDNLMDENQDIHLQVFQDSSDFMKSFIEYIEEQHQPDLFDSSAYSFVENPKDNFMQLAEIIGEVLLEKYEENKQDSWFDELAERVVRLKMLPSFEHKISVDLIDDTDKRIAEYAIEEAEKYIAKHEKSQIQLNKDRVNFLRFLLTQLSIKPTEYVYSQEIIENIERFSKDPISKQYIMQEVTGPLRDAGVLIASTSKGYKIPINQEDLYDYVKFSSSMALPMLRRIEKSREIVLQKTKGKVDILEHEEFDELKEFFSGQG